MTRADLPDDARALVDAAVACGAKCVATETGADVLVFSLSAFAAFMRQHDRAAGEAPR